MTVKLKNASVKEIEDVLSAFFCAFNAFPASSPSMPNNQNKTGELFFFLSCISSPP
jgi:hypothetical protein